MGDCLTGMGDCLTGIGGCLTGMGGCLTGMGGCLAGMGGFLTGIGGCLTGIVTDKKNDLSQITNNGRVINILGKMLGLHHAKLSLIYEGKKIYLF